jgi:hypothetical protein
MKALPVLHLNLATRPTRNRRFYHVARNGLAVLIVVFIGLAAWTVVRTGIRDAGVKSEIAAIERTLDASRQEERKHTQAAEKMKKADLARVNLVNEVILRKTFSWTSFLSEFETALPEASYITAFTPRFSGPRTVSITARVVTRSLDDLLALINALNARSFKGIQVNSEARADDGRLVYEMNLTYERPL